MFGLKYKKLILPLITEFFVHGEVVEALRSLEEIGAPEYSYEFVKRAINMSLDKGLEKLFYFYVYCIF